MESQPQNPESFHEWVSSVCQLAILYMSLYVFLLLVQNQHI